MTRLRCWGALGESVLRRDAEVVGAAGTSAHRTTAASATLCAGYPRRIGARCVPSPRWADISGRGDHSLGTSRSYAERGHESTEVLGGAGDVGAGLVGVVGSFDRGGSGLGDLGDAAGDALCAGGDFGDAA